MFLWIFISGLLISFPMLIPLSIKWELEQKIIIPTTCFIGIFSGIIINGILLFKYFEFYQIIILQILIIGISSTSGLLWRFYRDPERIPPEDKNAILSPADGKIIYIKKITKGKIPFSEKNGRKFRLDEFIQSKSLAQGGYLIGIGLTFLDVHINRAPLDGKISLLKHIDGLFISLKKKEAVIENERALITIDSGQFRIGVVLIASRLVRKIVSYIQEDQEIKKGERIGMIRFGSQVDLFIPDEPCIHIMTKHGEKVKAGMSIIAKYERNE